VNTREVFNHERALRALLGEVRRSLGASREERGTAAMLSLLCLELETAISSVDTDNGANPTALAALDGVRMRLDLISRLDGFDPDADPRGWMVGVVDSAAEPPPTSATAPKQRGQSRAAGHV
jgi:hypothetical protein